MDRSWLRQWLDGRFGRPLTQTPAGRRRKKKRTQLEVERLEDRTLFRDRDLDGCVQHAGRHPPGPSRPWPFPPQLNLTPGFAQPFWSIPQNWVNDYVPQNGMTSSGPGTYHKAILPIVNNVSNVRALRSIIR